MRIALDATPLTLTSGGLPRYVTELSLALAREFPEDSYIYLSDQKFTMPAGAPRNLFSGPGDTGKRWWTWGVWKALRATGAAVFHGTNFEVPYLGRTPAILTIHDLSPWRDPAWHAGAERVRRRTPWLIRTRRARFILTVSDAMRREIIGYFGLPAETVRAIPLAASDAFRPVSAPATAQRPFFLFVGTLEPRKNVGMLVDAWRETRGETGTDLVIAGRVRADFVPIPAMEGLIFRGEVPEADLPQLYSEALAFVYPSLYEGFGLPVLEAMQCGCPVITSQDPAIREVAGGAEIRTSAALHTGSARELADAMRAVAAHPERRAALRTAGLARAETFSWTKTARATRALYAEAARA